MNRIIVLFSVSTLTPIFFKVEVNLFFFPLKLQNIEMSADLKAACFRLMNDWLLPAASLITFKFSH